MTNVLQGPMEVVIGVVLGLGWGFISAYIPHRNEVNFCDFIFTWRY